MSGFLALAIALAAAQVASAAGFQHSYAVKFVCGYNPSNRGLDVDGSLSGEPPVKFGNYATEVNIYNFNLYGDLAPPTVAIEKRFLVLVQDGVPVGREPRKVDYSGLDRIELTPGQATMDDCNRIAQVLWGKVPTPFPLTIGYLVILSTLELDVTAVYTSQACSNFVNSPEKLDCLDPSGRQQGVSSSIHVNQVQGHPLH
jgi:hypothetical protein